jgi:hypothetical protein
MLLRQSAQQTWQQQLLLQLSAHLRLTLHHPAHLQPLQLPCW